MATDLPYLEEVEQLSPRVIRILGGNPSKVTYFLLLQYRQCSNFDISTRFKAQIPTSSAPAAPASSSTQGKDCPHGPLLFPVHLSHNLAT